MGHLNGAELRLGATAGQVTEPLLDTLEQAVTVGILGPFQGRSTDRDAPASAFSSVRLVCFSTRPVHRPGDWRALGHTATLIALSAGDRYERFAIWRCTLTLLFDGDVNSRGVLST